MIWRAMTLSGRARPRRWRLLIKGRVAQHATQDLPVDPAFPCFLAADRPALLFLHLNELTLISDLELFRRDLGRSDARQSVGRRSP